MSRIRQLGKVYIQIRNDQWIVRKKVNSDDLPHADYEVVIPHWVPANDLEFVELPNEPSLMDAVVTVLEELGPISPYSALGYLQRALLREYPELAHRVPKK